MVYMYCIWSIAPIPLKFHILFYKEIFISIYRIIFTDFIRICVSSSEACVSDSHGLSNLKSGLSLDKHRSSLRGLSPFSESVMS